MKNSAQAGFRGISFIISAFLVLAVAACALWADDSGKAPVEKQQIASLLGTVPSVGSASLSTGLGSTVTPPTSAPIRVSAAPKPFSLAAQKKDTYASFWPSRFTMAVSYRGRFENPSGRNYGSDSGDAYYLSRMRIETKFKLNNYVDLFAMTQDARVFGYNDPGKRPSGFMDIFDLRQAYADVHDELSWGTVAFRIGRQYLDFGSRRMVGVSGWTNSPPSFDAAKLNFTLSGLSVDVFASTRISNTDPYSFNKPKPGENLYGTYLSFNDLVPNARIEPYLFWRTQPLVTDELNQKGDSDLATAGFRFFGKLPHRLDYSAEFIFQRGTYATDSVSAFAGIWGMGYTLSKSPKAPKLVFEYNYATGDKVKGDRTRGTFDQMYPICFDHCYYGILDQFRNTNRYRIGIEVQATKRLKIEFDVNNFYLATVQDSLYNGPSLITNTRATSKHIGVEPDVQFWYKLTRQITISGGYGRMLPGGFLKQSTQGRISNFPFLSWDFRY